MTTATCGLCASVSNWKLESSSTTMSSGVNDSTRCSGAPVPMFPPVITRRRPDDSTSSISVVVVVLPFVPVTPTIGARHSRKKSAISVSTGILRWRARRIVGDRGRIPGMTKTKSGSARARSSLEGPSTSSTSTPCRRARPSPSFSADSRSLTVTVAPLATRNRARPAVVRPLPSPTIVTRRPRNSSAVTSGSKVTVIPAFR